MSSLINLGKNDIPKYHKACNDIVDGFDKEHRRTLGLRKDEKHYISGKEKILVEERFIIKDGDDICGFFDIWSDGVSGNVAMAVRQDQEGKGYGTMLAKAASKYIDDHINKWDNVQWACLEDNKPSVHLARKFKWHRVKSRDYNGESGHFIVFVKSKHFNESANIIDSIKFI